MEAPSQALLSVTVKVVRIVPPLASPMPVPPLSLAAIRQPAFLYDADGTIAGGERPAEALAGRPLTGRTLAAVVGIFDIHSPDGTPLMAADLPAARALAGEEAVDVPLVVTAADGRTLHVLVTAAPIRNGGAVVGALSNLAGHLGPRADARRGRDGCRGAPGTGGGTPGAGGRARPGRLRISTGSGGSSTTSSAPCRTRSRSGTATSGSSGRTSASPRVSASPARPSSAGRGGSSGGRPRDRLDRRRGAAVRRGRHALRVRGRGGRAGGTGWLAVTFLPIFGDSLLVITEDVTERKRAETALRERAVRTVSSQMPRA